MSRLERLGGDLAARLAGCPGADDLQSHHEGTLAPAESARLSAHLASCSACRSAVAWLESASAEGGESPFTGIPPESLRRLDRLVEETARPAASRGAASFRTGPIRLAAGIVLAGSLALAGYLWWSERPPRQEDLLWDLGAMRGGDPLELIEPIGRVEKVPSLMRWAPHPEAATYVVQIYDGAMRKVLTRGTPAAAPSLELDDEARGLLGAGGPFTWQVVAVGKLGQDLGRSPAARFEVSAPATTK